MRQRHRWTKGTPCPCMACPERPPTIPSPSSGFLADFPDVVQYGVSHLARGAWELPSPCGRRNWKRGGGGVGPHQAFPHCPAPGARRSPEGRGNQQRCGCLRWHILAIPTNWDSHCHMWCGEWSARLMLASVLFSSHFKETAGVGGETEHLKQGKLSCQAPWKNSWYEYYGLFHGSAPPNSECLVLMISGFGVANGR